MLENGGTSGSFNVLIIIVVTAMAIMIILLVRAVRRSRILDRELNQLKLKYQGLEVEVESFDK
jgi:hypothetical protein